MTRDQRLRAAIKTLNSALAADPQAINFLCGRRSDAGQKLIDHPTIECGADGTVGVIGLLNGVLRAAGIGTVAAVAVDEPGYFSIRGFKEFRSPETDRFIVE